MNDSVGGAGSSVVIACRYDAFKFDIFIHLFNEILRDRQPLARSAHKKHQSHNSPEYLLSLLR